MEAIMNGFLRQSVSILALVCIAGLAGACNESQAGNQADNQAKTQAPSAAEITHGIDVSRLPRVDGAKTIFENPYSTIFTAPGSVKDTAAALRKTLTGLGWKSYLRPHSANPEFENAVSMSFKKGRQALSVGVNLAPAQNNATAVSYAAVALPNDLPFPKDATAIEFDYFRPELICLTGASVEPTLAFYRKQLGALGWSLWSAKLGDKAPAGGRNGVLTQRGAYASYVKAGKKPLVLTLQFAANDKLKIEIKPYPMSVLEAEHRAAVKQEERAKGAPSAAAQPQPAKPAPITHAETVDQLRQMLSQAHERAQAQPKAAPNPAPLQHAELPQDMQQWLRKAEVERQARVKKAMATLSQDVPPVRAEGDLPIPLPQTAAEIDYNAEFQKLEFNSHTSVAALARFYRDEMKRRGWREHRSVINKATMVVLEFSKARQTLSLTVMLLGDHVNVSANGSALAAAKPKTPNAVQQDTPKAAASHGPQIPVPAGAMEVEYDANNGALDFVSRQSVKQVADFYRAAMKRQGWQESSPAVVRPKIVMFNYVRNDEGVAITINTLYNHKTDVSATGDALKSAAAKARPPSTEDLAVEESAGLPVPKAHVLAEGEQTPMRHAVKAELQLSLAVTLDFYRRELGKRHWREITKGAVIAADHAVITFAAPDGPAVLKLARKSGRTTVDLAVRNAAAAAKAGVLPKPGKAKLMLGNMLPADAVVTIKGKKIRVKAGAGAKGADGPRLDLPPGKYLVAVKIPGAGTKTAALELAAGETWGLLVGPGGALPMRMY
jgi:hypothetical protein